MTADPSKNNKSNFEWSIDQFSEPKAMSVGWDLSNLPINSGSKTNSTDQVETRGSDGDQTTDISAHPETPFDPHPDVDFDRFPEPRTVPANWNVSALL